MDPDHDQLFVYGSSIKNSQNNLDFYCFVKYLQNVISKAADEKSRVRIRKSSLRIHNWYQMFFFSAGSRYLEPRDQDRIFLIRIDIKWKRIVRIRNSKDEWQWDQAKTKTKTEEKINF